MRAFYIILFLGIVQAVSLEAYIYHAVVLRKWHADLNRYHYFIGLGDFHNKRHPANQQHLNELAALLASSSKETMRILTEDLSVANDMGRRGVQGFSINSRGGFLGGITDMCRSYGIETQNIEYRYARVCALGPVLNNPRDDPFAFDSTKKLLIGDLIDEIYAELDRIKCFNDGMHLQTWYTSCARDIEKKMRSFNWPACQRMSVADYIARSKKPHGAHLQNLLTFDAELLDAKMVHEIAQRADIERTCAIAGGSHIERASKALKKIGYTSVWHVRSDIQSASAIDAGSHTYKSAYAIKPAPISLHLLKKFF